MNSTIDNLNEWGGQFLQFAWPMFWQSSLLIALVFVADVLFARKIRASVRHGLWLVVLVKLLLPPTLALPTSAAWWLFPAKSTPAPITMPAPQPSAINTSVVVLDDPDPQPAPEPEAFQYIAPPRPKLTEAGWMLIAASIISTGLLSWLLLRWWQLGQKVRTAIRIERATVAGNLEDVLQQARQRAGLRSAAQLKLVEGEMSPAVCGLFRPVILLPRLLTENLSPAQLQAVLLHEMIHLRRGDIWVNCAQSLLQIFYWWHPLLWLANARVRRVREEAVDDAVMLALGGEAETYAPTLLEVAKLAFRRPLLSLGLVGIMESRSALRQRIERLINFRAPRKAGLTLVSVCGIFVFSAVAVPMGQGPAPVEKLVASNNTSDMATSQSADTNLPVALPASAQPTGVQNLDTPTTATFTGILTDHNYRVALQALSQRIGVATLGEPEITTVAGRGENTEVLYPSRVYENPSSVSGQASEAATTSAQPSDAQTAPQPQVLIKGQFFQVPAGNFPDLISGLQSNTDPASSNTWWSASPAEFGLLQDHLKLLGLKPLTSPLILTTSGKEAQMYIGDDTNGMWLDCTPEVSGQVVKMAVQCGVAGKKADSISTNTFQADTRATNTGGIAIRLATVDGMPMSNLVAIIGVQIAMPQVHIKARFIAVPKGTLAGMGLDWNFTNAGTPQLTGILNDQDMRSTLKALASSPGIEALGEPEVTSLSGRQIQMRATEEISVITNIDYSHGAGDSAITPQTMKVETGPVLDVVPQISDDGYSIRLAMTPSLIQFLGYDQQGQVPSPNGVRLAPRFETQKLSLDLNIWDNQTVILGGFKDYGDQTNKAPVVGDTPLIGKLFPSKLNESTQERDVLVFVTATVIDAAGRRVHSESQMRHMQGAIPPQPASTNTIGNSTGTVEVTTNPPPMFFQQRLNRINTFVVTNSSANPVGATNDTALHQRSIGMYTNYFLAKLQGQGLVTNLDASTNLSVTVSIALRKLFTGAGIDLQSPPGKSVYYNARLGRVFLKATPSDLNKMESVLLHFVPPASPALRTILFKLHHIRIPNVNFDGLSFPEAVRDLNGLAKQNDPDKTGVNFFIAANPDGSPETNLNSVLIQKFSLSNALLADVLDALQSDVDALIKHSINDDGIVFSPRAKAPKLSTRTFHLDRNAFSKGYKDLGPVSGDTRLEPTLRTQGGRVDYLGVPDTVYLPASPWPNPSSVAMDYLKSLGIDMVNPPGKSVGYNDQLGQLRVTATETDLDTIAQAIQKLNQKLPLLHLKARFIEVDHEDTKSLGFNWYLSQFVPGYQGVGILTSPNTRVVLQALSSRKGVKVLAEPQITSATGHRAEMFIGQSIPIFTNVVLHPGQTPSEVPQLTMLETGQALEATPSILADGNTIQLKLAASDTAFWGYADPKALPLIYTTNSSGLVSSPEKYLPAADSRRRSARVNLYDGQTAVFSLDPTEAKQLLFAAPDEKREQVVAKFIEHARRKKGASMILVFLTASRVDDTGARIHSDDQLPFAQEGIPPQPPATNDESADFPFQPIPPPTKKASMDTRLEADNLVQDGKIYYQAGRFDQAEAELNQAIALDAGNASATYYLNLIKQAKIARDSAWHNTDTQDRIETDTAILPTPNPYATNTLIHTGPGRQGIMAKLDSIYLDSVSYNNLPLSAVLDQLGQQCRLRDPERKGINFLINNNPDLSGQPVAAGAGTASSGQPDIGSTIIKIPSLTDVRMADILDAIVLVADHKIKYSIQDFAVVFSPGADEAPQLFMRTFRVDPNTFYSGLANVTAHTFGAYQSSGNGNAGNQQNNGAVVGGVDPFAGGGNSQSANPAGGGAQQNVLVPQSANLQSAPSTPSAAARAYFTALGINLSSPPGKSVFYNDGLGYLFVKGTETDLDTIERAIETLNQKPPEIHVKAQFYEAPKGTLRKFEKYLNLLNPDDGGADRRAEGILTTQNAASAFQELRSLSGIKLLAAPEITTITGRQSRMRATRAVTVVTNVLGSATTVQIGPELDVIPYVLVDGYSINLSALPSNKEFDGYEDTAQMPSTKAIQYPGVLPKFTDVRQMVATANIWDGQTLLLGLNERVAQRTAAIDPALPNPDPLLEDKELLIFVTATIVDSTGKPVHTDNVPFARDMYPPQAVKLQPTGN